MKILFFVTLFFYTIVAHAQQDPIYAQYMLNPVLINPAYTGLNNNLNIMVGYRTQWTGMEGQPETFNATAHSSFLGNKIGGGVIFSQDRLGNISNLEAGAAASYKIQFKNSTISFGMLAGFQSFSTDNSILNVYHPDDDAFSENERGARMNIGAGAILFSERYFIGVSVPRLKPTTFENSGQEFQLYDQHYYLMGSYIIYLNNSILLKPSALLRDVRGAPLSYDLSMNFNFNSIHSAGFFTRNFNTYGILLQTIVKEKYRLGYVFEMPTNHSVSSMYPTHEVSVGLLLSAFTFHERSLSNF